MQTLMPVDIVPSTPAELFPVASSITAEGALAMVMGGADPKTVDLSSLRDVRLDYALLNRAVASLLGQQILSRMLSRPRTSRERLLGKRGSERTVLDEAHHLATQLAESGLTPSLTRWMRQENRLEALLLLSRLQLRALVSMCEQIDITAEDFPVSKRMSTISAREKMAQGGRISDWMQLIDGCGGEGDWLHATSTVCVNSTVVPIVADAGPDLVSAAWAARMAAPVTIRAAAGYWPTHIVSDALDMCAESIASWVAAMSRELAGDGDADLALRTTVPLRNFIVAPAVRQLSREMTGSIDHYDRTRTGVLIPGATSRYGHRDFAVSASKWEPGVGEEMGQDAVVVDAIPLSTVGSNELAALSLAAPQHLEGRVPVTINVHTPEWEDVTDTVEGIRASRAVTLREAAIGHVDQDVIEGDESRVTLRVLVDRGVPIKTTSGYAIVLPAGTKITVTSSSVRKHHALFYGTTESVMDSITAAVTEAAASAVAGLVIEATESAASAAASAAAAAAKATGAMIRERTWIAASAAASETVIAAVTEAARAAVESAVAASLSDPEDGHAGDVLGRLRLVS